MTSYEFNLSVDEANALYHAMNACKVGKFPGQFQVNPRIHASYRPFNFYQVELTNTASGAILRFASPIKFANYYNGDSPYVD